MIKKSNILSMSVSGSKAGEKPAQTISVKAYDNSIKTNEKAQNIINGMYDAFLTSQHPTTSRIHDGSFNNSVLKLGASDDGLNAAQYLADMITFQRAQITNIYHGSWIFRRIVDKIAQDMWSSGISIEGDTDPEILKRIYKRLARLRPDLIWVTEQARLYGGAAALIMVDDGTDSLEKPLNLKGIKKGSSIQLWGTDRWFGLETSPEKVRNYKSRDFNTPKYYTFFIDDISQTRSTTNIKVHHSRVLRFVNRRSVRLINTKLNGWGISELEHIFQDLMIHENAKNSAGSLIEKALLEIVQVEGMRGIMQGLSTGSAAQQAMLTGQLAGLENFRTNHLVLMDKSTEYKRETYTFSGLSELLDTQKDSVAGAAEMPKVLLYGDTKGGLTSDSPAEMEFYAGTIQGKQDEMLRPVLDKLLPVIYACEGEPVPTDMDYDFESIAGATQTQKLELLRETISAVNQTVENGMMTHETGLKEIQQVQKVTGFGTNIEQRDIDLAKQSDIPENDESDGEEIEEPLTPTNDYEPIKDNIISKIRLKDKRK